MRPAASLLDPLITRYLSIQLLNFTKQLHDSEGQWDFKNYFVSAHYHLSTIINYQETSVAINHATTSKTVH